MTPSCFPIRVVAAIAAAAISLAVPACSGSSSPTSSGPVAHFTPDTPTPADGSITMLAGSSVGTAISIRVTVTKVNTFFGAAFRVHYDPTSLLFRGIDTSSSFLTQGVTPGDVDFQADAASVGGEVIVVATRLNPTVAPPVDVTATSDLLTLQFQARKAIAAGAAGGLLSFDDPKQVCDGTVVPSGCGSIAVTWSAGSVTAH
jgi:hypothetical protein